MDKLDGSENVARVLKTAWVYDGEISPSAFSLRPHIRETYISVLRELCDTFSNDLAEVVHRRSPVYYAKMNVGELRNLHVDTIEDDVYFDVKAVDNLKLLSHSGIFVYMNNIPLIGGEPFESFELKRGMPADSTLMTIRETLSEFAKKSIVKWKSEVSNPKPSNS